MVGEGQKTSGMVIKWLDFQGYGLDLGNFGEKKKIPR